MAYLVVVLLVGIGVGYLAYMAKCFGPRTKRLLPAVFAASSIVAGTVGFWYVGFVMRDPTAGAGAFFLGMVGAAVVPSKFKTNRRFLENRRADLRYRPHRRLHRI